MSSILILTESQEEIRENNELENHETRSGTASKTDILNMELLKGILEGSEKTLEHQTVDIVKCYNETKDTQTVNPLMIDLVLENLMSFLSWKSLTKVRMVNSAWNNHAITQLRLKHRTICLKRCKEFNEVMMNTLNFPFGWFHFRKLGSQVFKLLDNFGHSLTNVTIWTEKLTLPVLRQVMVACKSLEYLQISTTPFFSKEAFVFTDTQEHQLQVLKYVYLNGAAGSRIERGNASLLENFFQLLPKLKSIRFGYSTTSQFFAKSFQAMNVLPKFPVQNLQELKIYGDISEDEIKILQKCNFQFKTLKLGHVCINSTTLPVSEFLESQRDSLVELEIDSMRAWNEDDDDGAQDDPIPLSFAVMSKLKIFGIDHQRDDEERPGMYFVDAQLNSIFSTFPNLRKLQVFEDSVHFLSGECFTEGIQELGIKYEGVPDERHGENDTRPHLEILRIRNMFPNMHILMLDAANSIYAEAVFRELINLTELNLHSGHFGNVDTLLTGIHEVHCSSFVLGGELLIARSAIETYFSLKERPGVCDLKNLRKLKIHLADDYKYRTEEIRPMTDVTGYLALLQMKPLEKLKICNSSQEFSDRCIAALTSYHREVKFI